MDHAQVSGRRYRALALALVGALVVVGCSSSTPVSDAVIFGDHLVPDAIVVPDQPVPDMPMPDVPQPDVPQPDVPQPDGGPDLGPPDGPDGPPPPDQPPPPDGGMTTSAQIAAARAAQDGVLDQPVSGAIVTYVLSALGNDPAGFSIQGSPTGPALFIAVDPADLTPAPEVGNEVSFTITSMATSGSQRRADAISGFSVDATGQSVAALTQNLSAAADLVSNLDGYDTELVTVRGTLAANLGAAGAAHSSARLDTAGVSGNDDLHLRVPDTLRDSLGLRSGCVVTVTSTPLWRFNTRAQVSAFVTADIAVESCPSVTQVATLVLNEVAPAITGSIDLIELRAVTAGPVTGITVEQNVSPTAPDVLATLPAITVAVGDLIVVHLNAPAGVTDETASKTGCGDAACFSGAFDVRGGTTGITFADRVLSIHAPDSTIQDAVVFGRPSSADRGTFPPEVQGLLASGQWVGACGSPCDYASNPTVLSVAVDWSGASSTSGATTVQRTGASDTHSKADWSVATSTMGAPN